MFEEGILSSTRLSYCIYRSIPQHLWDMLGVNVARRWDVSFGGQHSGDNAAPRGGMQIGGCGCEKETGL